jgi:hypothetical protein
VNHHPGNLVAQNSAPISIDEQAVNGFGQARCVAHQEGGCVDRRRRVRVGRHQASHFYHRRPDHASITDQLEHHVLREDPPASAPADLERLVHDCHRKHHDDRAGRETSEEWVTRPKVLGELFGCYRRR